LTVDQLTVTPALTPSAPAARPPTGDPAKIHEAAQQFEALLLTQLLQGAHPDGGWLGSGQDGASDTASSFAEQQLAVMMAKQGGIGLANLVTTGLEQAGSKTPRL
jgi:Rod binding domain-containing protein